MEESMTPEALVQVRTEIENCRAKLDLLRNYQIVADQGLRQQQSAANDEILAVIKDISNQLTKLLRAVEK